MYSAGTQTNGPKQKKNDCVQDMTKNRLDVLDKKGDSWFVIIENSVDASMLGFKKYIKERKERWTT